MKTLRLLPYVFVLPSCLFSQAWLSPKGEGTFSTAYQYGFDRYHVYSQGEALDKGHIFLDAVVADVDYSLTNRLAVRVQLPFIEGEYLGKSPHLLVRGDPSTAVKADNGNFQGGFQDFRIDVRYNVASRPLMFTPFFQAIIPSHSYPYFGHATIGLDQREYRMGMNFGRRLNPILPKAYFQGRYAFGFGQEFAGVARKTSYLEGQLGYMVSRRVLIQGSSIWTYVHNGIDFIYGPDPKDPSVFPNDLTEAQYINHDRISRVHILDAGGSATYRLNRSTSIFFGLGRSVYATNTHLRSVVVTVGFTKSFSTRWAGERLSSANALVPDPNQALVCTCAKSR